VRRGPGPMAHPNSISSGGSVASAFLLLLPLSFPLTNLYYITVSKKKMLRMCFHLGKKNVIITNFQFIEMF